MNIRLFCNAGMSTSILVKKMVECAQKQGVDADIKAFPVAEIGECLSGTDIALLGPQVGYLLSKVKPTFEKAGIPVDVIPMVDYGMCNGEAVLSFALSLNK